MALAALSLAYGAALSLIIHALTFSASFLHLANLCVTSYALGALSSETGKCTSHARIAPACRGQASATLPCAHGGFRLPSLMVSAHISC